MRSILLMLEEGKGKGDRKAQEQSHRYIRIFPLLACPDALRASPRAFRHTHRDATRLTRTTYAASSACTECAASLAA